MIVCVLGLHDFGIFQDTAVDHFSCHIQTVDDIFRFDEISLISVTAGFSAWLYWDSGMSGGSLTRLKLRYSFDIF